MTEADELLREGFAAMRAEANDPTRLRPSPAREAEHRFLDDMEASLGLRPTVSRFELFAIELRRRTQARLHYCSHTAWHEMIEVCKGCSYTRQEIVDGRA